MVSREGERRRRKRRGYFPRKWSLLRERKKKATSNGTSNILWLIICASQRVRSDIGREEGKKRSPFLHTEQRGGRKKP